MSFWKAHKNLFTVIDQLDLTCVQMHISFHKIKNRDAKWNKPVRERQIPYALTYMWNLTNKID